jgi:hypothetical protein
LQDTAIRFLGFARAFRRSELVALDVVEIAETETGLLVTFRRSKTDHEGRGERIAIARGDRACPVTTLGAWLEGAGTGSGSIFRPINKSGAMAPNRFSDRSVANIVKTYDDPLFERRAKVMTRINLDGLLFVEGLNKIYHCHVHDVTNDGAGIRAGPAAWHPSAQIRDFLRQVSHYAYVPHDLAATRSSRGNLRKPRNIR